METIQLKTKPIIEKKKVIDYSKETTLPALARCSNDQARQTATVATSNKYNLLLPQQGVLAGLDSQSKTGSALVES